MINRGVFPDIIIHQRGIRDKNLLIIEIKKSSSGKIACAYDGIKLGAYTMDYYGNKLQYQLGAYISFGVKELFPNYEVKYYKNGNLLNW